MNKKLIITALLSLVIGIFVGMGVDQSHLLGTATDSNLSTVDGKLVVNGQSLDLESALFSLDSSKVLDDQMKDQLNQLKDRNNKLKEANDMMAEMRQAKAGTKIIEEDVYSFCIEHGIKVVGAKGDTLSEAQWDENIELLSNYISSLYSDSEREMIILQQLTNKRNQTFEQITNMLQEQQKVRDAIVSNMR
ncbi:MAG: hypothetical protein ACM3PE_05460 [Deltaproteobacteria bacterium]